jgi:hypothetical protein
MTPALPTAERGGDCAGAVILLPSLRAHHGAGDVLRLRRPLPGSLGQRVLEPLRLLLLAQRGTRPTASSKLADALPASDDPSRGGRRDLQLDNALR